jgi:ParB-like chromosome segregation protein Spo0J
VLNSTDKAIHEIALRENLDRVDLHPIEEGEGYVSLLDAQAYSSHDAIAKAFGKPKSRITECIGFTRLPAETKVELLNKGTKNRSLLRALLNAPVEKHGEMILEAMKLDEGSLVMPEGSKKPIKVGDRVNKGDLKPFTFEASEKKVKIPGYVWKVGEGKDRLLDLHQQIKKLSGEIEALLDLI